MYGLRAQVSTITLAQIVATASAAIWTLVLVHTLPIDQYGAYAAVTALVGLVASIPDMGIGMIASADVAQHPQHAKQVFCSIVLARVCFGGVATIITTTAAIALHYTAPLVLGSMLGSLSLWIWSVGSAAEGVLLGLGLLKRAAVILMISPASLLAVGTIALLLHARLIGIFAAGLVASIIAGGLSWFVAMSADLHYSRPMHFETTLVLLRRSFPVGLAALAFVFYNRVDQVLLAVMVPNTSLAYYNIAFVLGNGLLSVTWIPAALVMYPRMARAWAAGISSFAPLAQADMGFLAVASVILALSGSVAADWLVPLAFGSAYKQTSVLLQLTLWSLVGYIISAYLYRILLLAGRERVYLMVSLVGLAVNLIGNILLIPTFGVTGACIALLVTQIILLAIYLSVVARVAPGILHIAYCVYWFVIILASSVFELFTRTLSVRIHVVAVTAMCVVLLLLFGQYLHRSTRKAI